MTEALVTLPDGRKAKITFDSSEQLNATIADLSKGSTQAQGSSDRTQFWGPSKSWSDVKKDYPTTMGDKLKSYGTAIAPALQSEFRGAITDPMVGIAQAVGHVLGQGDRVDQFARNREAAYQAERAKRGETGTDWWQAAGNVMSPLNYLGGGGANALARVGVAARAGAVGAGAQPVTSGDNFWAEKAKQVGAGTAAGSVLGGAGEALGGAVSAAAKPVKAGVDAVKRYLGAEMPSSLQSAAVHRVLETFGRDEAAGGPKLTEVMDLLHTAREAGKPMTLADLGSDNVKSLAGYLTRKPGESMGIAKNALETRDAAAGQRLHSDITKYVSGGDTMKQTADALTKSRAAAARPLYEEALAKPVQITPRVQQFMDDPVIQKGIKKGIEVQRLESLAEGKAFSPEAFAITGFTDAGDPILGKGPNMRTLDSAKRGLDEILEGYRDKTTGRLVLDQRGRAIDQVRQAFVSELDRLNPSYKVARASWSGPSQSLDAMQKGRDVFQRSPEEIADMMKKASPNEKEFIRLGVADKLRQQIDSTGFGGDEAKALIKSERNKQQFRALFDSPEQADKFIDAVLMESRMFGTRSKLTGGSQTAERLAGDSAHGQDVEAAVHGVGAAKNALTGRFMAAASDMWKVRQALGWRKNQAMNAEIAKLLFDPALTQDALQAGAGTRLLQNFPGPHTQNYLAQMTRQRLQQLAPAAGAIAPTPIGAPNQ